MSHLVFARKYRPQNFKSIVGQEHVTRALVNAIIRDKVPHALLFNGPRGVGKTTSARVLSKALNCTGREIPEIGTKVSNEDLILSVEPCGECSNCIEITKGSNLAVVEIDGASNNSVENVRHLIETLLTAPPPNIKYKIYIIDEVHMLSTAAFNALLKTLEEPPPNTIFILATTEPHKIPDTVISRCQQHDFRRFSVKDLKKQLQEICDLEKIDIDSDVLTLIAKRCQGGMRDASSLLERVVSVCEGAIKIEEASQVLGVFGFSHFIKIVEEVLKSNKLELFDLINEAFSASLDLRSYFSDLVSTFRIVALYSLASSKGKGNINALIISEELSEVEVEALNQIVALSNTDVFFQMYDLCREVSDIALSSEFPKFALEAGVVKLASLGQLISLSEVLDRISNGENYNPQKKNISKPLIPETSPIKNENSNLNVAAPVLKTTEITVESKDVDTAETTPNNFQFIWGDFLNFLKKSGHIRFDTYLKRVAPKNVACDGNENSGIFHVLAPKFVYDTFNDPEIIKELKLLLTQFSLIQNWKITFDIHQEEKREQQIKPTSPGKKPNSHPPAAIHVPGSFEGKTQEKRATKIKSIEEQAKDDELVRKTLSIFAGSVIEKITPIQKS